MKRLVVIATALAMVGPLAPNVLAGPKRLAVPTPSAGNGTLVTGTFKLKPKRSSGKVRGRPGLKLKGKPGSQRFAVGAIVKVKRHTYRATVALFHKKQVGASAAVALPSLSTTVIPPPGSFATKWAGKASQIDIFTHYADLLQRFRLNQLDDARLQALANLRQAEQNARDVLDAIRALAEQRETKNLIQLVGSIGGTLPPGFGGKKTPPAKATVSVSVDHSVSGALTTLCAHVTASPIEAGTEATVTVTRLDDSAKFGPKKFFLDANGLGVGRFEINPADGFHTDVALETVDGILRAGADGIGPLVSTGQCPPASS